MVEICNVMLWSHFLFWNTNKFLLKDHVLKKKCIQFFKEKNEGFIKDRKCLFKNTISMKYLKTK